MEIIADVECSPRRIYTGTIGFVEPGGRAQFNVAIRTVLIESRDRRRRVRRRRRHRRGFEPRRRVAGEPDKARVLAARPPAFDLLETMLWKPDGGYLLLGRHLKRLLQSAEYFGFHVDVLDVRDQLERSAATFRAAPHRVRLVVSRRGAVESRDTARHRSRVPGDCACGGADRSRESVSLSQDDERRSCMRTR